MPIKITAPELAGIVAKGHKVTMGKTVAECLAQVAEKIPQPTKADKPKRKKRDDGYASQAEADFAAELESLRVIGSIRRWKYEPVKGGLRLNEKDPQTGRNRHYRPDFLVEWESGYVEWIEVKGKMKWEDAMKTFDWARDAYPFWHFRMVEKIDGDWVTIRGENHDEIL
jgi:hypothetical protein